MKEEITVTLDDLAQQIAALDVLHINIPNMIDTPYTISPVVLVDQQYYFEYQWNIRQQRCYLSVFKTHDNQRIYYVKNRVLLNGLEVSRYIKETDWVGTLYFESVSDSYGEDYNQNDISEKFVLTFTS